MSVVNSPGPQTADSSIIPISQMETGGRRLVHGCEEESRDSVQERSNLCVWACGCPRVAQTAENGPAKGRATAWGFHLSTYLSVSGS